jgi:hypothetical protein
MNYNYDMEDDFFPNAWSSVQARAWGKIALAKKDEIVFTPKGLVINMGSSHKVVIKPHPVDNESIRLYVLGLSTSRHKGSVHVDGIDVRGYISGCKDVNVALTCDALLDELHFLRDILTQGNY